MAKKELAAIELSLRVRCAKLMVESSKESIEPMLSAELVETVEKGPTKIALKGIESSVAETLRDGMIEGREYEFYVQIKEVPSRQTRLDFAEASAH